MFFFIYSGLLLRGHIEDTERGGRDTAARRARRHGPAAALPRRGRHDLAARRRHAAGRQVVQRLVRRLLGELTL